MKLYCDMDGVLVDLIGGIKKYTGVVVKDPHLHPQTTDSTKIPWDKIKKVPLFWESLDWFEGGDDLWYSLVNYHERGLFDELCILTARSKKDKNCVSGKMKWLAAQCRDTLDVVHIVERANKKNFALDENGLPNVLIDDYEKNINEWNQAGGIGILHRDVESTLNDLMSYLNI